METNKKIIYLDEYRDRLDYKHQRYNILALAENKFNSRDKAEAWITTPHPIIDIQPQALLGTPLGYHVLEDMLHHENARWAANVITNHTIKNESR